MAAAKEAIPVGGLGIGFGVGALVGHILAHVLYKQRLLPKWYEADGLQKWLIAIGAGLVGAFCGLLIELWFARLAERHATRTCARCGIEVTGTRTPCPKCGGLDADA
jgi:hypothetical protein